MNQVGSQLPRPALHDQVAAFHRDRRQEDAVGQVLEVVEVPADTDLTFDTVQSIGLERGLVDNKSCAIDESWQALRFVYRLKDR